MYWARPTGVLLPAAVAVDAAAPLSPSAAAAVGTAARDTAKPLQAAETAAAETAPASCALVANLHSVALS